VLVLGVEPPPDAGDFVPPGGVGDGAGGVVVPPPVPVPPVLGGLLTPPCPTMPYGVYWITGVVGGGLGRAVGGAGVSVVAGLGLGLFSW
jgi:hypothetical protein